jgi:tyrosinase
MASPDYAAFRTQIDLGIHPAAHKYIGGDLYDFYTSPSDPVFFLLHSQVDRLWALWQGQDYAARKDQVGGTVTFRNLPPSENATLSSVLRFDQSVGEDVTFKDTVSSVENAFCYVYA